MFQYKAVLLSTNEIIAEGHSVQDVENDIKKFKRAGKKGEHTRVNEKIEIIHIQRDQRKGVWYSKEETIKVV